MRRRNTEVLICVCISALLAVALTWPLAARFGTAARIDSGDGRFSIWNIAWVANVLTTNPRTLFDANIFYPQESALAYSEANLVAGVLAIPIWLATGNPIAASNWTILCAFTLTGVLTYFLIMRLTGSRLGSVVGGMIFTYCLYTFSHIAHVQLLMTFGFPLVLLCLHRFVEAPTTRRAVWLGVALAVQALACGYYGLFGGLMTATGIIWFGMLSEARRSPGYWLRALLAGGVAAALVLPALMPYFDIRAGGFERSLDDARLHSADWRAYLASPMLVHRWLLPIIGTWKEVLFPGFLALTLTPVLIYRVVVVPKQVPMSRKVIGYYAVIGLLALWASFGPDAGLYRVLYDLPMFSMLRAPSRFGVLVVLALAILSGAAFALLTRPPMTVNRRWIAAVILLYTGVRSTAGPLSLHTMPPLPRAYERLAALPTEPVVAFPYFASAHDRHRHTWYMLLSTYSWHPLINGVSDYVPDEAYKDMLTLRDFPSLASWQVLRDRSARFVVVHWGDYSDDERPQVAERIQADSAYLRAIVHPDRVSLFEIVAWPDGTN